MSLRVNVVDEAGRRPKRLAISAAAVRKIARGALLAEKVKKGELNVLVTRNHEIQALNARFRGKDAPTNVLSFPGKGHVIGDIAISLDYVDDQGRETGAGFRYTFAYYLVHGVLHLLGYDHERERDAKKMYGRTEEILEELGES